MKEKISFVNEIWNVGAPRWRPYFEQRNRRPTKLCHTQCWKRGFLFFIEAWIQRHQQSPRIVILKAVCRFVVLLLSTFSGFSMFAAGFPLLWQLCSLLCRPPQRSTERSRIFDPSSLTPGGAVVPLFAVSGGEMISWRGELLFANLYELKSRIWF